MLNSFIVLLHPSDFIYIEDARLQRKCQSAVHIKGWDAQWHFCGSTFPSPLLVLG